MASTPPGAFSCIALHCTALQIALCNIDFGVLGLGAHVRTTAFACFLTVCDTEGGTFEGGTKSSQFMARFFLA